MELAGKGCYMQEIFDSEELIANLEKNAVAIANSVYDPGIYDSKTITHPFAVALDNAPQVKMVFKTPLPSKSKRHLEPATRRGVRTLTATTKGNSLILEPKKDVNEINFRAKAAIKIHCGKQHFKALGNKVA